MLGIFDHYNEMTKVLMKSLETANISYTPLFVHYDGELPEDALSPFTYYTKTAQAGSELFFNEVPVPEYAEIRQEKELFGEILQNGYLIGKINYRPNSYRRVQSVDWLLRDMKTSHTDFYNQYGNCYATSYYHNGTPYQKVYYRDEAEILGVNLRSGFITLLDGGKRYGFANLTDFFCFFMDELHMKALYMKALYMKEDRILINSLSYPLFITRRRAKRPNTILFWQEKLRDKAPENMAEELLRPKALTDIVFFNEEYREKIAAEYPSTNLKLNYLSHIGQFAKKEEYDSKRAFILTNSDQIAYLETLLSSFPGLTISVAALTRMSEKLHGLTARYPNLVLYPTINQKGIAAELQKASVYLDFNAGGQVLEVVKAAYYNNLLVLALITSAKAADYSLNYETVDELIKVLSGVLNNPKERAERLTELHQKQGVLSTAEDYEVLLDLVHSENAC